MDYRHDIGTDQTSLLSCILHADDSEEVEESCYLKHWFMSYDNSYFMEVQYYISGIFL